MKKFEHNNFERDERKLVKLREAVIMDIRYKLPLDNHTVEMMITKYIQYLQLKEEMMECSH